MPMNVSRIDNRLQCIAYVMIHQLNCLQFVVHPLPLALMRELYYKYERSREYTQQELVNQCQLRV